jgi:putative two-component system response regulator
MRSNSCPCFAGPLDRTHRLTDISSVAGSDPNRAAHARGKKPAAEARRPRRGTQDLTSVASHGHDLPSDARTDEELEQARYEALLRLALAAEPDQDAAEHAERVALSSFAIATQLGLSRGDAELIYHAAPLHDLGKVAIPGSLLLKRGELSPIEFEQVKTHTTAGAGLLRFSGFPLLRVAREIALTHHEHWDGSGYPAGLRGEEIPLSGRIVALADVFDALTHNRPYKKAWTVERAVAEVRDLGGRQFDPAVVDAFLRADPSHLADLLPSQRVAAEAR